MLYEFKNKSTNPHFTEVEDVTPQEVFESTEKVKLVDVREISEFTGELGHAPQSELVVLTVGLCSIL